MAVGVVVTSAPQDASPAWAFFPTPGSFRLTASLSQAKLAAMLGYLALGRSDQQLGDMSTRIPKSTSGVRDARPRRANLAAEAQRAAGRKAQQAEARRPARTCIPPGGSRPRPLIKPAMQGSSIWPTRGRSEGLELEEVKAVVMAPRAAAGI
jgi:hypothetical protein